MDRCYPYRYSKSLGLIRIRENGSDRSSVMAQARDGMPERSCSSEPCMAGPRSSSSGPASSSSHDLGHENRLVNRHNAQVRSPRVLLRREALQAALRVRALPCRVQAASGARRAPMPPMLRTNGLCWPRLRGSTAPRHQGMDRRGCRAERRTALRGPRTLRLRQGPNFPSPYPSPAASTTNRSSPNRHPLADMLESADPQASA